MIYLLFLQSFVYSRLTFRHEYSSGLQIKIERSLIGGILISLEGGTSSVLRIYLLTVAPRSPC